MPTPLSRKARLHLITSFSLIWLTACADAPSAALAQAAPTQPPAAAVAPAAVPAQAPKPQTFAQWRDSFRQEALDKGIDAELFDRAFAGVTPDEDVIRADRSQPEFSRP
ncbi:MAG TPA: lytic murein transglycosylase, partial [Pseudomonas sp.]|nr:lytic murein transglycosylase [Pseudomonas sp.]